MITEDVYKQALGSFPSGVTVVTTYDPNDKVGGLTASAFSALSMDPALVLFCPHYESDSYPILLESKRFAINILAADQTDVAFAFAKKGEAKINAIEMVDTSCGKFKTPIIKGAKAVLECSLWEEYAGGDHAIMIGKIESVIIDDEATPMVYCQGKMGAWEASAK